MPRLAAWSIDRPHFEDVSQESAPKRIRRSHFGLEKWLEDWIANDVTLIGEGLTLIGRQISIDDGRLDLLALDSQDRWVVIEIKPGMLYSDALHQALYYASSDHASRQRRALRETRAWPRQIRRCETAVQAREATAGG